MFDKVQIAHRGAVRGAQLVVASADRSDPLLDLGERRRPGLEDRQDALAGPFRVRHELGQALVVLVEVRGQLGQGIVVAGDRRVRDRLAVGTDPEVADDREQDIGQWRGLQRPDEVGDGPDLRTSDRERRDVDRELGPFEGLGLGADRGREGRLGGGEPGSVLGREVLGRAGLVRQAEHEVEDRADVPLDRDRTAAGEVADRRAHGRTRTSAGSLVSGGGSGRHWAVATL